LPPSGSAQRANSLRAAPIQSAFTAGKSGSKLRPLAGWAKP